MGCFKNEDECNFYFLCIPCFFVWASVKGTVDSERKERKGQNELTKKVQQDRAAVVDRDKEKRERIEQRRRERERQDREREMARARGRRAGSKVFTTNGI